MNEHRDKPYVKWGLTALVVIFVSILLVVIFTDLPGFFGVLTALEMILEPLIFGVVIALSRTMPPTACSRRFRSSSSASTASSIGFPVSRIEHNTSKIVRFAGS